MQALSQSSFLLALGYAIANSFWQVALLWLITVIVQACFKLSSHNRYQVAITAQLGGFAWFIVTLQFYYQQCIKATADAQLLLQTNTVVYQPDIVSSRYNLLSYIAKAEMLLPYLSLAYLCLLCVLAVRWLKSYRYTSLLKQEGLQKADMDLRMFVQDMAARLGIKHKVKVYLSTLVNCPLTIGFFKPIILIPVATVNHLTMQQLEAVLLHELAHIRRADYLFNLLLNIIETILFFNPFTWLISQTINKEREHCCDDWVLQFKYNAPMYAEALLRIACLQASPAIVMKAEGKSEGELLWRIKRLLNQKQKRFNYSQQMIALVVTTCMLISIAWLQPSKTAKQAQQATATKPVKAVVVAPMAAQINNPLFNPLAFFSKQVKEEVKKATSEVIKAELDKTIDTSLDEAGKALTAVTPSVLNELDNLNNNSNFEQVSEEAQKELKKVKWSEIKQIAPVVDSAAIADAVKLAFAKTKLSIDWNKIKQSLAKSKQQLARLKQQNLEALINQNYLNAANNAATWIEGNDLIKIQNDNNAAANDKCKEKKARQQREQAMILRKLYENRTAPHVQSFTFKLPRQKEDNKFNKTNEDQVQDNTNELATWSYSNPVYIEKTTDEDSSNDTGDDSIYSYTSHPSLEIQPAAPPAQPAKPLVQVIEVTSEQEHVSIIITIRP